ncbi:glycoside hydrolase family 15 protein, partial [Candidatus Peregrinibacteria bacterium]|nr:glycoside hydrolase family 15 protein [Candidatus Peregrinibacteria bacterium]
MPKALVLSNGKMLVDLEHNLQMSDFYYPHVGMEDHSGYRKEHKIGVFTDGRISWLENNHEWYREIKYERDSLVGDSIARNDNLQVELNFNDLVCSDEDVFLRRVKITNLAGYERNIKLYFHSDFYIYGEKLKDTAEYEPKLNGVLHYRNDRYFLVFGMWDYNNDGISNYAIGKSSYAGKVGTWKDAEDGDLQSNPVEQGSVDSTVEFDSRFKAGESKYLNFMIAAGKNYHEIVKMHDVLIKKTPKEVYKHTRDYWKHWSNKMNYNFENIDSRLEVLFKRSLLLIKSQTDQGGAVIAANDSDIMRFNKDTYSYMWGRDSAIVIMALSHAHYSDITKDFFKFVSQLLTSEGYLLHKYNP